ncbi:hypothetical protein N657DRAFT_674076 [Parathielavia appendiculata]|uniref:Uncharacterized protein n=1 Tax=Parathielavia appendiculata TaxID=2587402 RepID=A0AAN6TUV8_9PEZI|nr:hypothetical protein N657DRAFT_674076 [Parathielavia appendiculata]
MLLRRTDDTYDAETCEELGLQQCGTGCIALDYTCCPSKTGDRPRDKHCVVGDDGKDGWCKNGYVAPTTAVTTSAEEAQSSTSTEESKSSTSPQISSPSTTTTSASPTEATSVSTSTNASTIASYSASTIYITTTITIIPCPASHSSSCSPDTSSPHITVITETLTISTTLCPIVEFPPLPTPTTNHPLPSTITLLEPVVTPDVVCPGEGKGWCHPVTHSHSHTQSTAVTALTQGTGYGTSSSVRAGATYPTTTARGNDTVTATATKGIVTSGAARIDMGGRWDNCRVQEEEERNFDMPTWAVVKSKD